MLLLDLRIKKFNNFTIACAARVMIVICAGFIDVSVVAITVPVNKLVRILLLLLVMIIYGFWRGFMCGGGG